MSCKKTTNWDVDASFPIAQSYLNINNFFGDSLFVTDTNNLLHFAISKEIINYTMDSLVKLPDTTIALPTYTASTTYSIYPGNQIYTNNTSSNKEITFDIANGVQLNKAIVKKGTLKIEFSSEYDQPINFKYTINSATLWGNMFQLNQVIPGNANGLVKYYSLDGYTLDFTGQNFNKINTLVQTYTISADASGQPSVIQQGKGFSIKMSYVDIVPEYIQGYFGQQDLSFGPDSTKLDFLGNINVNNFALTQSSINFRIINEFGIELSSSINSLKSIKSNPLNIVTLNSGNLLSSINVNRATKTNNPSNPVYPFVKQIIVNSSNSNLNQFIQNFPNYLGYSINAKLNPLGNISSGNDFAFYGKGLRVYADIDIPLSLSANYFKLENYSEVDLTQIKEINNINSCELIIDAENNYAFKTQIQGYMVNEQNQIIDSLFVPGQNTIEQATITSSNKVVGPVSSQLISYIDKVKLNNLMLCKKIKFVSMMFLPNQPTPIKINNDSYLKIDVSANLNYHVNVK